MAQQAQGWRIRLAPEHKIYCVRFRHGGKRFEKSTGTSDPKLARKEAEKIFRDVVGGRRTARRVSADLKTAFANFLADYEISHAGGTNRSAAMYVRAHLLPFFGSFERFTVPSYSEYMRERIQKVTRASLRKELSCLRQFRSWCAEQGLELPPVPPLPKHGHPGKRHAQGRKRAPTILTPNEVERILACVPEASRPFFSLVWETGLRPYSTILKLETPLHYVKGSKTLFIAREIDKRAYERSIPLTDAARAVLDKLCSDIHPLKRGPLFTQEHRVLRGVLAAAVRAADIGKVVSIYDFRHSRISLWANSGRPLTGVAFLAGHKHLSTTSIYVRASVAAAEAVLA